MSLRIALAGNPNSGKTTLFNILTGSNQFVGNWPGVTVEKKAGRLKGSKDTEIVDLPGIYSLSPYSPEETVARNYLAEERPDVIINIVDGTNIERNLYLTTQLLELGIPVLVAVNMMDMVEKRGDRIFVSKLSEALGCPVAEISALKGTGVSEAAEKALALAREKRPLRSPDCYSPAVRRALDRIETRLKERGVPSEKLRFFAVKVFERDEKLAKKYLTPEIERIIAETEKNLDDDAESIITAQRYDYITKIVKTCMQKRNTGYVSTSDKIDRIVTNRILALPIFAAVMFLVYFVSVTTVGGWATDWANDGLFGEGFRLFGLWVPGVPVWVDRLLTALNASEWLRSLISDGIVAGVGGVLGFVPQMAVLFAFLAFLEGCGYMARIAFIMDRLFRKFGLSGKSFIPILIGSGCGVPGIMASRTIENDRDRKMTVITTTFIPCGAKLPIIALIAGALFDGAPWVAPTAYLVGIAAIVCSGVILKKTHLFAGDPAPFVMELPAYRMPTLSNLLRSVWDRASSFIKKAGTVILLSSVAVWFLMNYGFTPSGFGRVEDFAQGLLARFGSAVAPIFAPLGFGDWQAAAATLTGLIAKENLVGTFGVIFGFGEVAENGAEIWGALAAHYSALSGFSLLLFNLLCAPCVAAMGAIRREMNSPKWTFFAIGYQCALAYAVSLCVYQFGRLFVDGVFDFGTVAATAVLAAFLYLLFAPGNANRSVGKKAPA